MFFVYDLGPYIIIFNPILSMNRKIFSHTDANDSEDYRWNSLLKLPELIGLLSGLNPT